MAISCLTADARAFLFAMVLAAAMCRANVAHGQADNPVTFSRPLGLVGLQSTSGRFIVVSPGTVTNYVVMRWAEDLLNRYEEATDLPFDVSPGPIRITVADAAGDGMALLQTSWNDDTGPQRLRIVNLPMVRQEDIQELFCLMLLEREVMSRALKHRMKTGSMPAFAPQAIPRWLVEGVAQNLMLPLRERSRRDVLERWQRGGLLRLEELIDFAAPMSANVPDGTIGHREDTRAVHSVFVGWLLTLKRQNNVLADSLDRLAQGELITPDWLVEYIPGCGAVAQLDERWDEWLLRRKQVIRTPGQVTPEAMEQLRVALLLYTGDSGIPLHDGRYERVMLRDLIDQRKAEWMRAFCASKQTELRLLSAGRGEAYGSVIDRYCSFFEALGRRMRSSRLEKLLGNAESAQNALSKGVEGVAAFDN